MARKNPSAHSDQQLRPFVERINSDLESMNPTKFAQIVRRLVLQDGRSNVCAISDDGPAMPALDRLRESSRQTALDAVDESLQEAKSADGVFPALLGRFFFNWSNSETLLIDILVVLLKTDEASASLVFASLNSTRARLDLIEQLVAINIRDTTVLRNSGAILALFSEMEVVRSNFAQALYSMSENGEFLQPIGSRQHRVDGTASYDHMNLGHSMINTVQDACSRLKELHSLVMEWLPKLRRAVAFTNEAAKSQQSRRSAVESLLPHSASSTSKMRS